MPSWNGRAIGMPATSRGRSISKGPGPAAARQVDRLPQDPLHTLRIHQHDAVLHAGAGDADGVHLLEGVLPQRMARAWPVMMTSGIESMYAVAIPVTALVTPGPDDTRHTPTSPLART